MSKSCEWMRPRMARCIDGELPAEERAAFEAHLRKCSRCEHLYDSLRQLDRIAADAAGASGETGELGGFFERFQERFDLDAAAVARTDEMDSAGARRAPVHWSPEQVAEAPLEDDLFRSRRPSRKLTLPRLALWRWGSLVGAAAAAVIVVVMLSRQPDAPGEAVRHAMRGGRSGEIIFRVDSLISEATSEPEAPSPAPTLPPPQRVAEARREMGDALEAESMERKGRGEVLTDYVAAFPGDPGVQSRIESSAEPTSVPDLKRAISLHETVISPEDQSRTPRLGSSSEAAVVRELQVTWSALNRAVRARAEAPAAPTRSRSAPIVDRGSGDAMYSLAARSAAEPVSHAALPLLLTEIDSQIVRMQMLDSERQWSAVVAGAQLPPQSVLWLVIADGWYTVWEDRQASGADPEAILAAAGRAREAYQRSLEVDQRASSGTESVSSPEDEAAGLQQERLSPEGLARAQSRLVRLRVFVERSARPVSEE